MKELEIYTQKDKLEKQHKRSMNKFDIVLDWFNSNNLDKLIPEHWNVSIQDNSSRLLIIHHSHYENGVEQKPLISFNNICECIENIGIVLEKEYTEYIGGSLEATSIKAVVCKDIAFNIHIRQCQVDKCEIEYVEEVVKKPVLSGFCAEALK